MTAASRRRALLVLVSIVLSGFSLGPVERPVSFAANEIVLAVPADGAGVWAPDVLTAKGVTVAIDAHGAPIGDYTRMVLDGLPGAKITVILANVRSTEPDVGGIVEGARNRAAAQAFVDALLSGAGATALKRNGFGRPAAV